MPPRWSPRMGIIIFVRSRVFIGLAELHDLQHYAEEQDERGAGQLKITNRQSFH